MQGVCLIVGTGLVDRSEIPFLRGPCPNKRKDRRVGRVAQATRPTVSIINKTYPAQELNQSEQFLCSA